MRGIQKVNACFQRRLMKEIITFSLCFLSAMACFACLKQQYASFGMPMITALLQSLKERRWKQAFQALTKQ